MVVRRAAKASGGVGSSPSHGASSEAVTTEYTFQLQEAAKQTRKSVWKECCSRGAAVGLCTWLILAAIVYVSVQNAKHHTPVPVNDPSTDGRQFNSNTPHEDGPSDDSPPPEGCRETDCRQDGGKELFGSVLGIHDGVPAYSNCNSRTCISLHDNVIQVTLPRHEGEGDAPQVRAMPSGMKWQCVEYARRYWMLRGRPIGGYFGSVIGAADIWTEIAEVHLTDGTTTPLLKYPNGLPGPQGGDAPRAQDLLIYPRDDQGIFPYGHVAVVVGVDLAAMKVYIAEQNWESRLWPGPFHNYSRVLMLEVDEKTSAHTIVDPSHSMLGWVRYTAG